MHKTLFFLVAMSCSLIIFTQNTDKNGNISGYALKGNIKEIITCRYSAKMMFGEVEKGDLELLTIVRMKDNKKIEELYYNSEKKYLYKDTFIYDTKGNMIEAYFAKSINYRETWKYNEKNKIVENTIYYDDGKMKNRYTYVYDINGREIEDNVYNSNGTLSSKGKTKYDSFGNRIEYHRYKSNGQLDYKGNFTYNSNGNLIEEAWRNADGSLRGFEYHTKISKTTYKYDSYGNRIEESDYNSEGIVFRRVEIKFNSSGKRIEIKSYDENSFKPNSISTNKYDRMENNIEFVFQSLSDELKRFSVSNTIEYDQRGNWIKYISYDSNNSIYSYYTREIKYW